MHTRLRSGNPYSMSGLQEVCLGQKVHPYGFRIGVNRTWHPDGLPRRIIPNLLHEDLEDTGRAEKEFVQAGISKLEIDRLPNQLKDSYSYFKARSGDRQKRCWCRSIEAKVGIASGT